MGDTPNLAREASYFGGRRTLSFAASYFFLTKPDLKASVHISSSRLAVSAVVSVVVSVRPDIAQQFLLRSTANRTVSPVMTLLSWTSAVYWTA